MAKAKKIIKKNIEKNKNIEKQANPVKNNILLATRIVYVLLLVTILVYAITLISKGSYHLNAKDKVDFDYSTIIAGEAFNRSSDNYYVVFYKFDANSSLTSTISNISTNKIYKVDLNDGMNKYIVSDNSNISVQSASDLRIKDITLIAIEKGKNVNYIEGLSNVNDFLSKLK